MTKKFLRPLDKISVAFDIADKVSGAIRQAKTACNGGNERVETNKA